MKYLTCLCMALCYAVAGCAQNPTLRQQMLIIQRCHHVFFVYDARLEVNMPYRGPDITDMSLKAALRCVFAHSNIDYEVRGRNVLLRKKNVKSVPDSFRLKGMVTDSLGEPLVSVSVYDLTSKRGTLTNEQGRYTINLPPGRHELRLTYMGCKQQMATIDLNKHDIQNFVMDDATMIEEVVVNADMNSPVLTTQTGKRTLSSNDIKTEFALLSSPDVVKSLQRISGVASGIELSSGLFVHGGNSDENLFLIDGAPLYQTNHSLGLFSSFNADIVKNVDFYKSGFPARYSGRVSSVIDVRTRDGNMKEVHGLFSLGLLDGRLQVEGPLVKNKTSFNLALRRSWIDALLKPAYATLRKKKGDGDWLTLGYAFHDFNARITHRANDRRKLWLSFYSGHDNYSVEDESKWSISRITTNNWFKWGSINATAGGDFQLSPTLSLTATAIGTYSYSLHDSDEDDTYSIENIVCRNSLNVSKNKTKIYDIGAMCDLSNTNFINHHIRLGGSVIHHVFHPQFMQQYYYFGTSGTFSDTTKTSNHINIPSEELSLYLEDEFSTGKKLSANIGTSYTLFNVNGKTYHLIDPRLAMKWQANNELSLKVSYTHMSQCVHRIASTFLEIPSDFWVPTTDKIHPVTSNQIAGGIYMQVGNRWTFSAETFCKFSNHLLQYRHWMGLLPPATRWEQNVTEGRGKAYGVELDATYKTEQQTFSIAYILSFSKRYFKQLYDEWFDDQFDNRHRLNAMVRRKLTNRISAHAAFTLRSGNRMSLPVATAIMPQLPDEEGRRETGCIYGRPNNFTLPTYHRLDVGFNFHHTTRRGHDAIWNVSLYNAYCHMNTMYAKINCQEDGTLSATSKGFIPIIPSVSYTLKF